MNQAVTKVELGGGSRPRGDGFANVDFLDDPAVSHRCNFESEPLPFPDDSIEEVYCNHRLEGLGNHQHILHEIARVCVVGARVEIRVPHWCSDMALCPGHRHTISPTQVRHWCQDFVQFWWAGQKKRLRLLRTEAIPGEAFALAKDLLGWFTDDQIMALVPNACHELRYHFDVTTNG